MAYSVKEIFYTLQGEGVQTGACYFLQVLRLQSLVRKRGGPFPCECRFCDTDFVGTDGPGGGVFDDAQKLAQSIAETFPRDTSPGIARLSYSPGVNRRSRWTIILSKRSMSMILKLPSKPTERYPSEGLDWITVSPKANTQIIVQSGNELKLVYPQEGVSPSCLKTSIFTISCSNLRTVPI